MAHKKFGKTWKRAGLSLFIFFSLIGLAVSGQQSVLERVRQNSAPETKPDPTAFDPHVSDRFVTAHMPFQGGAFWTERRKQQVDRYPCQACHTGKPDTAKIPKETVHGTIQIDHGETGRQLSCTTCHTPDRPQILHSSEIPEIDMDHSYDLCGQCHFRQKQDWIGGAHGKRISDWAGKRVVKNCVSCHNPHHPRFPKRWPATYSPPIDR